MDPSAYNYNSAATVNESCIAVALGCIDPNAYNFDPQANTDNSTCINKVFGCTDSSALNFDPGANTEDGNCIERIVGCATDRHALNYNELANDAATCFPKKVGCMDSDAFNYDSSANTEAGYAHILSLTATGGSKVSNPL